MQRRISRNITVHDLRQLGKEKEEVVCDSVGERLLTKYSQTLRHSACVKHAATFTADQL